jgi:hypothetical protein
MSSIQTPCRPVTFIVDYFVLFLFQLVRAGMRTSKYPDPYRVTCQQKQVAHVAVH